MVDNVYRAKIAVYCPRCDHVCYYIFLINEYRSNHYLHDCFRCGFKFGTPGKAQCFSGRLELNSDVEIIMKKITDKIDNEAIKLRLHEYDRAMRDNLIKMLWCFRNSVDKNTRPSDEYLDWLEEIAGMC